MTTRAELSGPRVVMPSTWPLLVARDGSGHRVVLSATTAGSTDVEVKS